MDWYTIQIEIDLNRIIDFFFFFLNLPLSCIAVFIPVNSKVCV